MTFFDRLLKAEKDIKNRQHKDPDRARDEAIDRVISEIQAEESKE